VGILPIGEVQLGSIQVYVLTLRGYFPSCFLTKSLKVTLPTRLLAFLPRYPL